MSKTMDELNSLAHYGMPRRSGRYPWGSGEDSYQRGNRDLLGRIEELKKSGWTETPENIEKEFGMSTTQYRAEKAIAKQERRTLDVARAKSLREDGLGYTEIGRQMGVRESTVRSWLDPKSEQRMTKARETANFIKEQVDKRGMIDVGAGVESELNISKEKLNQALKILQDEGYPIYGGRVPQALNPGKMTTLKIICPPGTEHKEIYNYENINSLKEYITRDGGKTFEKKFHYPESLDSSRLKIRYNEEGGDDKDGIIELRRGVDDLSLGNSRYAQVRIMVDKTHYLKGMAVYSDDMPEGVDVVFNTNKKAGTPMTDVLKKIKDDPDNPFGSLIKDAEQGGQYWYTDKNGNKKLGLINKRAEEGDWSDWKDVLPSQFLSKQSKDLAKKQLTLAKEDKQMEFESICEINNPTIKKHLLEKFASKCDSAAVDLKAAALPGQKYHVIIPVNSLKDTEVYAPQYDNGTKLALVRYPHGGIFEIPILTVNNKHAAAKQLLGTDIPDAIGINKRNAKILSGADFDGDTVMCIPTHDSGGRVKIINKQPLEGLKDFDPVEAYGPSTYAPGSVKIMSERYKQNQMGVVSNLITDMTILGAKDKELERAVRHSMVVIDAVKHKLDYRRSEVDNNIQALKERYQRRVDEDGNIHIGSASTIISRASGEKTVYKRQGEPYTNIKGRDGYDPTRPEGSLIYKVTDDLYKPEKTVNKKTGVVTLTTIDGKKVRYNSKNKEDADLYYPRKKVDKETNEVTYTNKDGSITYKLVPRTQKSTRMAEVDNAYDLVSSARHPMELLYADYANTMKSLANKARIEKMATGKIEYDKNAKAVYEKEVKSLMEKLDNALLNAPRERLAQLQTSALIKTKKDAAKEAGEDLTSEEIKKLGTQALNKYRTEIGSIARRNRNIDITDREWDAIQAGAISENKLNQILNNTDIDVLRQRATPRATTTITQAKANRISSMRANGYTITEIARKLGVSTSTVSNYIKGGN